MCTVFCTTRGWKRRRVIKGEGIIRRLLTVLCLLCRSARKGISPVVLVVGVTSRRVQKKRNTLCERSSLLLLLIKGVKVSLFFSLFHTKSLSFLPQINAKKQRDCFCVTGGLFSLTSHFIVIGSKNEKSFCVVCVCRRGGQFFPRRVESGAFFWWC